MENVNIVAGIDSNIFIGIKGPLNKLAFSLKNIIRKMYYSSKKRFGWIYYIFETVGD